MKMTQLLSLCFALTLIPTLCMAGHSKDLKSVLDEYTYSMTVEWDQRDEAFALAQNELLKTNISSLLQSGLSQESLRQDISALSGVDVKEIEDELKLIDVKSLSAVEGLVKKKLVESYDKGASWNGNLTALTFSALLITTYLYVTLEVMGYKKDL